METTRNKEGNGKDHSVSVWKEEIGIGVQIICTQVAESTVNVGNLYSEPYLMQKPCAYLRDTLRIGPELFK